MNSAVSISIHPPTFKPAFIHLAPMEGVVDPLTRKLLTELGGIGQCVTEFVRVTDQTLPRKVFYRFAPELTQLGELKGKTDSGVPTFVQLLGGNPEKLASNARKAAKMGALGIDLNFGCPAKTVNRHDGGACLLQWPQRLHEIVQAVRREVPSDIPVTAKMRLGFEDKSLAVENALALQEGGAAWVTLHARTKLEAYKPPAHWEYLALVREALSVPLVANGDIWNLQDWRRCREISGCQHFMLGRGAIACPDLPKQIWADAHGQTYQALPWHSVLELLMCYFTTSLAQVARPHHAVSRLKQWLKQLPRNYPPAEKLFSDIRKLREPEQVLQRLNLALLAAPVALAKAG